MSAVRVDAPNGRGGATVSALPLSGRDVTTQVQTMRDRPVLPPGLIPVGFRGRGLLLLITWEFRRARAYGATTGADVPPGAVVVRFGRSRLLLSEHEHACALQRAERWREALRSARRELKAQRDRTAEAPGHE